MPRPIHARIDSSALKHNLQVARSTSNARIMAVIKADAYGHGLLRAAEALKAVDGFALLDVCVTRCVCATPGFGKQFYCLRDFLPQTIYPWWRSIKLIA